MNLRLFDDMPEQQLQQMQPEYKSPVNEQFIDKLNETLKKYTQGKKNLESKIIENDRWYRSQHWDLIRGSNANKDNPEPVTAYLFNTIANKHADAMDYYPEPNIFEREQDDVQEAQTLSKIIPLIIEKNNFRKTYSNAWWYKLKQGCSVYGVFWNPQLEGGLGDIDIQKLDLLNIYWEPGITDIQKSPYLFVVSLVDDEALHQMYPQTKDRVQEVKPLEIKTYVSDDTIDLQGKSLLVDAYYKKQTEDGRTVVHLTKYVDNMPLASTEDDPQTAQTGLYDHGMYPIILDPLFPEESTPVGFGFIDIVKNPQMYIDKLDQIISKNALISGKLRTIVKENGSINEEELADLSKDIIHTKGGTCREGEDFATIQAKPLPQFIVQHRQNKINELKEIAGNRDFQQGGTAGGVTAMGAILALQEAGNKLSRDMIGDSYAVYTQIIYMCIELIRQFYDEPRMFRIIGDEGNPQYIEYTNRGLKPQPLQPAYEGEGNILNPETGQMEPDPNYQSKYRTPIFDIKVKPEKASPFSREAQNELAKELFQMGFFNPEMATQAKIALEMMSFEGKDKVYKMVMQNGDLYVQMQQMQQELQQQQQIMQAMNEVIKRTTGRDMFSPNGRPVPDLSQYIGQEQAQGGEQNDQM
jgi:hypothetical protein